SATSPVFNPDSSAAPPRTRGAPTRAHRISPRGVVAGNCSAQASFTPRALRCRALSGRQNWHVESQESARCAGGPLWRESVRACLGSCAERRSALCCCSRLRARAWRECGGPCARALPRNRDWRRGYGQRAGERRAGGARRWARRRAAARPYPCYHERIRTRPAPVSDSEGSTLLVKRPTDTEPAPETPEDLTSRSDVKRANRVVEETLA